jgi:hypothetical protein
MTVVSFFDALDPVPAAHLPFRKKKTFTMPHRGEEPA